jgi:hypothetical protein
MKAAFGFHRPSSAITRSSYPIPTFHPPDGICSLLGRSFHKLVVLALLAKLQFLPHIRPVKTQPQHFEPNLAVTLRPGSVAARLLTHRVVAQPGIPPRTVGSKCV